MGTGYGGTSYGGTYGGLPSLGSQTPVVDGVPREPTYAINVDMYNFLIAEIRDRDKREGFEFVKRYLKGPQIVWDDLVALRNAIPNIWSAAECPEQVLPYLKAIVGWTKERETKKITDKLDSEGLRRLIQVSGALWRQRGPEDLILFVLSVLTRGARARIWNWFDFRWVLDETELGEEHQGRDPWIINLPGSVEQENPIDSGTGATSNAGGVVITLAGDTFSVDVTLGHRFRLTDGVMSGRSGLVKTRDGSTQITLQGTGLNGTLSVAATWEVVDEEYAPDDDRRSNLRIMDLGTLDRDIVKRVLRMMRSCGERFDINYLHLLDLFNVVGDFLQWAPPTGADLDVSDGMLRLVNTTQGEVTHCIVTNSEAWVDYVVSARLRGTSVTSSDTFGLIFYRAATGTHYYYLAVETNTPALLLYKAVAGTPTLIQSVDLFALNITLLPNIFYAYRVAIVAEGASNRIQVFFDGAELMSELDNALVAGSVGFFHDADAAIEIDEVEVFALPADTDTLEINEYP